MICFIIYLPNEGEHMRVVINLNTEEKKVSSIYQVDVLMELNSGLVEIGNIPEDLLGQLQDKRPQYTITYRIEA